MRALVIEQPGLDPRVCDVPVPAVHEGSCLVRLSFAQVNHLDGELLRTGTGMPATYPLIPGMEGSGTVVEAPGESAFVGTRVAVPYVVACGSCAFCRSGHDELCQARMLPGVTQPGTCAEYIALPRAAVVPIPDAVALEDAAGFQGTLTVAWHAATAQAHVRPGQVVLVTGATGTLGWALAEVTRVLGGRAIGLGRDAARLEAVSHWFSAGVLLSTPGWTDGLRARTDGAGVDAVIDLVGGSQLGDCLSLLRPGGTLVALGSAASDVAPIDARLFFQRQISIRGSRRFRAEERSEVLGRLARGELRMAPAQQFRLEEAPAALEAVTRRRHAGRVLIGMP